MDNCTGLCGEHSGVCQRFNGLECIVNGLKNELHEQKGYVNGMLNQTNQDVQKSREEIREVTQKLRDEMKEMKKEIQAEMKTQLDDIKFDLNTGITDIKSTISNNATKKENKFNLYLASGIFPTIIVVIGYLLEHYFGK